MDSDKILAELNSEQRRAVTTTEGPLLILAGAGSGKTKVITHRIAFLLSQKLASSESILAVTFTNKAAQEMRSRLARILDQKVYFPYMGTFHGICVRILRREIAQLGLNPNFTIYDSNDSSELIKKIMQELSLDPKRYSHGAIKSFISGAKNELMDARQYRVYANGPFVQKVCDVYDIYQQRLIEASALDFDDLIMTTVRLMREYPAIASKYCAQFRYIHIDEYQDTNSAQYELVKLLASGGNICVVGDDFQAIYGWRGANFTNILNFEKDYPRATVIKLEQNYRSTATILGAAQNVIEQNRLRSKKKLWTAGDQGVPISVYASSDDRDEAEFVASEIKSLTRLNQDFNNFVILYRTNAQSRIFEDILMKLGMPYRLVGALRFWERREIKDILAFVKFALNPVDEISFFRVINLPPRGLGATTLSHIDQSFLRRAMEDYSQAISDLALKPKQTRALEHFFAQISHLRERSIANPGLFINEIIERFDYKNFIKDGTDEGESRWENLGELISVASTKESVEQFLEEATLASDIDNYNLDDQAVTLMTIHNAKGLEFATVFICGVEEGLFPHSRSIADSGEVEEERRLFYVGMTRAKQRLYIVYAASRLLRGTISANIPSRFIEEIPEEYKELI